MAAPPARLPPARGVVAALARPWFPPPWRLVVHPGHVALKFNSKRGNLVPPLVPVSGYRAPARAMTPLDGGRWEAQGGPSSRPHGEPAAEPQVISSESL